MSNNTQNKARPLQLSWERLPSDPAVAETLQEGLRDIVGNIALHKTTVGVSISLVTKRAFSGAYSRSKGTFTPERLAQSFVERTYGTVLRPALARPDHIEFRPATNSRIGSRVALMLNTPVENEQRVVHNLLHMQGYNDRPFLPGTHISIGTIAEPLSEETKQQISTHLLSLMPAVLEFDAVTQRTYTRDGFKSDSVPLLTAISPTTHI